MSATEFQSTLINLQDSLMRFAYSLTTDKDDAKDLVQETNFKALNSYDKYVLESNFKAWTFTIMKNTFINSYRRNINQNIYRSQVKESFYIRQSESVAYSDPESAYSAMEISENIEQLKDIFRIPFKMYIYGYKYKEIADKLSLNIGTVKSRIYMSRRQLMNQLNR
jgi:RNA polymerase sigma-70 factor, ECF subfamily